MGASAVLYVQSLERMRGFYTGCFDLVPVEDREGQFVVLGSASWELTLVLMPNDIARQNPLLDPPARRDRVPVKLGFTVASIETTASTLRGLGGDVGDGPLRKWEFRGTWHCDVVDPEGNVIQLLEPV